jgi:putative transposase
VNQLGLVEPVDGFGQRVVITVASAAHRRLYALLIQAFGVANADVHQPGLWQALPADAGSPFDGNGGQPEDNAMAESFFASLEGELIERSTFQSKAQARMAVFTWIEGWYNPRRRHSGLGYHSPLNFERSNEALFDVVGDAVVHVETTPETV